jgi:hypothetical protein
MKKKTEISVVCQAKIATVWNQDKYCIYIYVLLFGNIRRNFQSASNNLKSWFVQNGSFVDINL